MKITNRHNIIVGLLLSFLLLSACERTELCYDHYPTLALDMAWEHEWERDYGMHHQSAWDSEKHGLEYDDLRPERPDWVNMVITKPDGTSTEKFIKPEGETINVDLGDSQSYMFYNGDTEYIMLYDIATTTKARASATARLRSGLSYINERHPGARSTNSPDILYAAYVETTPSFNVHDHHELDVKMQPLVFTYIIRYEFEYGLEHVSLARGALGGMAESVYLYDGRTSDESSVILFDCDVKDFGCEARINSFGIPGHSDKYYGRAEENDSSRPYSLNLEILLRNGKSVDFNYDISDQIAQQPRGGVITISNIKIEDQIGGTESGFNVDVTDWPNHDVIDLPIEVEP